MRTPRLPGAARSADAPDEPTDGPDEPTDAPDEPTDGLRSPPSHTRGRRLPSQPLHRQPLRLFADRRRLGLSLLAGTLALLTTVHMLVRTSVYGAGIDVDSVFYISIAANLLAGQGFQDFVGNALHPWPPLFPLFLATVGFVAEVEPHDAARFINAAAFGLTVFATAAWLSRALGSRLLVVGATLAPATSPYLGHFASTVRTEALFVLFSLLALMQLDSFRNHRPTRTTLTSAILFSALAATTRYAGVAVVATGTLLLLVRPGRRFVARVGLATVFGGVSLLPLAATAMRNRLLLGAWDTPRGDPELGQSAFESLRQFGVLARRAVAPADGPEWLAPVLWASAVLLVVASVATAAASVGRRSSGLSRNVGPAGTLGGYCLVYTLFIVVAVSAGRAWDTPGGPGLSARFLIPLYVPALMIAAIALDRWLGLQTAGWATIGKRIVAGVVVVGAAGSVAVGARTSFDHTLQALESGHRGKLFNTAYWDESETIRYLRDNPVDVPVHANSRFGLLHAVLALKSGNHVVGKYRGLPKELGRLKERIESGRLAYFVWFKFDAEVGYEYDEQDLRSLPGATVAAELADGVVFRATSAAGQSQQPPEDDLSVLVSSVGGAGAASASQQPSADRPPALR